MDVILNTGSTVGQGYTAKSGRKLTEEYKKEVAVCRMNPEDFRELWHKWGSRLDKVKISTDFGEVVVYVESDDGLMRGQIFIPRGPWANMVISSDTSGTGSPFYKGMRAEIKPTDEDVLDCEQLFRGLSKK